MTQKLSKFLQQLVTKDPHKRINLINPQQVIFDFKEQKPVKLQKIQKLEQCLGAKLSEYEINGAKIFADLTDRQKGRIPKAFGGAAKYKEKIVRVAEEVATDLKIKDANDYMAIIEIVAAEFKELSEEESTAKILSLQKTDKNEFIENIQDDYQKVTIVSKTSKLKFSDSWTALYHYRKHRASFESVYKNVKIEDYLIRAPNLIFQDTHLTEICIYHDGAIKKTFITPENFLGVTIGTPNTEKISTMHAISWITDLEKLQKLPHRHRKFCVTILPPSKQIH